MGAVMELDLGRERLSLEIFLLLLGLRVQMLAQTAKLMLERGPWIWLKARILVPEWAGRDRGLCIV